MRIEVINTGTELMLGQVVNTHLGYFGERLLELGLRISRQVCVPDGDPIREVLVESIPRCEAILVTGGLGPTSDDITREITAELFGMGMELDRRGDGGDRGALRKDGEGAEPEQPTPGDGAGRGRDLAQWVGHRAGAALPVRRCGRPPGDLPAAGPPRELQPMFEEQVLPVLKAMIESAGTVVPEQRSYYFYGIGESDMAAKLARSSELREPGTRLLHQKWWGDRARNRRA